MRQALAQTVANYTEKTRIYCKLRAKSLDGGFFSQTSSAGKSRVLIGFVIVKLDQQLMTLIARPQHPKLYFANDATLNIFMRGG